MPELVEGMARSACNEVSGANEMSDILAELGNIKEAAEAAVALSEDPILVDRLDAIVTEVEGWIDQLTPRAAATEVKFPQDPAVQQPLGAAPSQEAPVGTEDAPAANADTGGAEDEPLAETQAEPEQKQDPTHHSGGRHRR